MKLLLCSFGFHPEKHGVAAAARLLAEGLLRKGHAVTVATGGSTAAPIPPELEGLVVRHFEVFGNANPRSRYRGEVNRYLDFISRTDADVAILLCWQIWSTDLALRALPKRVKVVLLSQGVVVGFHGIRSIVSWLLWRPYALWTMPRMLRRLDRLVLPSARLRGERFLDHRLALATGSAVDLIPNTVHPRPGRGGFRERHSIATRYVALLVGNFGAQKNQLLAIEALRHLRRNDVTLVLVGSERNEYSDRVTDRLKALGKEIAWRLLFDLDDAEIWDAYAECDLVLITSLTEYQPLVALQAMSVGRPVVSTDVGCVGDLPGCLVVPPEAGPMAEKIRKLLDDPVARSVLGKEGADGFRASYSFGAVTDRWDQLIRELTR